MGLLQWHRHTLERLRRRLGLTHYQVAWLAFCKGIVLTLLVLWLMGRLG